MHVGPSQVQGPGDVVEGGHEHPVGMLLSQRLTDAGYLLMGSLAGILQRIDLHGVLGNGRPVAPDPGQRVEVGTKRDAALLTEVGNQFLHKIGGVHHPVDSHLSSWAALPSYPLGDGGRAFDLQFHQLVFRAPQLFVCSQEIARVGPEGSRIQGDHCRTRRAIEARDPLTAFPMLCHILTLMRIGTGENTSCQMLTAHHLTEVFQSLIYIHFLFIL